MDAAALLPASSLIVVDALRIEPTFVEVAVRGRSRSPTCPACSFPACRVHSRYERVVGDLPWRGTPVKIRLLTRRFFCDNRECPRRIFSEQLDELVPRRGQSTPRFDRKLLDIGMEAGGAPGARLAVKLGVPTSGPTILRRLRRASCSSDSKPDIKPVVIGVDDFALRRGQVYGTLFVDHQSQRVIDIIPDRSSASTTDWLKRHPSISIVTRDRSALYAKGIRDALPTAVQVADRWHLLHNAREALVAQLDRSHREIAAAHAAVAVELSARRAASVPPHPPEVPDLPRTGRPIDAASTSREAPKASKAQLDSLARRQRRQDRYEKVMEMHHQRTGIRAIARALRMSRNTVVKFIGAGEFPEHSKRRTRKSVDPFAKQLRAWWDEGVRFASELHRRIVELGFKGSSYCVRRLVAPWRDPQTPCSGPCGSVRAAAPLLSRINSNRLAWLLIRDEIDRAEDESLLVAKLMSIDSPIATAARLCREFGDIVRSRDEQKMREWIDVATAQAEAPPIASFASGLRQTEEEVFNAMRHGWSNGRAEGHVNRIKMIKRKMYGRANFDLLRIRVLAGQK